MKDDDAVFTSYRALYEEAERQLADLSLDEEQALCPLYHALRRVEKRYGEETLIGRGGMKEVFKVYDEHTERFVALARPREGVPIERYDSFLREAHITARLEHPNIINLFDMGIDERMRPFFTMEFKRGQSLRKILSALRKGEAEERFPYEARLSILLRVCDAMSYAHSRRVLHLDLKPDNIQVGTFGEVQVCDWGMGEVERDGDEEQDSVALLDPDLYGDQLEASIKGTPGYMAPELSTPRATKTPATDIYSLGCLLFELSTLHRPSRRHKLSDASPAVAAIVEKACAEDPADRYPNVQALREDVKRHLMGYSVEVENAGVVREVRLFFRRNRQLCVISLVFIAFALTAAVWFTQKLSASHHRTTEALARTEEALVGADAARARAEEALERQRQEREFAMAVFESREDIPEANVLFLIDFLMVKESISLPVIDNAMAALQRGFESNPPPTDRRWTIMAHVLFMTQRFEESERYYAIRQGSQKSIRDLIPEFAPLVAEDGLLPVDEFIRLLKTLSLDSKSRYPLMEKMIIYDSLKRKSLRDTARILRVMLELSNRGWRSREFAYDRKNGHLRVSGKGLRSLYRKGARRSEKLVPVRSLLRLLPLRSLDISGSDIDDLWNLDGLDLENLDIRGTPVVDLEPLNGMVGLRRLVIEPGQFDRGQLAVLRGLVEVVETTDDGR